MKKQKFFSPSRFSRPIGCRTILVISLILIWFLPGPLCGQGQRPSADEYVGKTDQAQPQTKITLRQAIKEAWQKSLPLDNLRLEADRFAREAEQILRQKRFTVTAASQYLYKSQTIFLELPRDYALAGPPSWQRIEAGLKHNYDFSLAVAQPIFTGGRLTATAALYQTGELVASTRARLIAHNLASNLKLLYFQYHRLQAKKNSLRALLEQLSLHEKKTESLVEAQLTRRLNLVETKIKREEVLASLCDLEKQIAEVRISFHHLCGYFPEAVEENFHEPSLSLEEALAFFEQNHPQLKVYQEKLHELNWQKKIAQAKNLPQVAGFLELHYGRPGLNFFKKEWSFYAQAGLAVQFRLFDWHQARGEVEVLQLEEQKIMNEREEFKRATREELEKIFAEKKLLEEKMKHLDNIIHLSTEEVKMKEQLVGENLLPHIDYLVSLQAQEQNKWLRAEVLFELEGLSVKVNYLISRQEEVWP